MARWSLEVLSTRGRDRDRWGRYIDALPNEKKDVFLLPEYSALYEDMSHEPALLFRYGDDRDGALMVAAKRSVADLPFYRSNGPISQPAYYDVASPPYGYGGPVVYSPDSSIEPELFTASRDAFHKYCVENGIVAEFLGLQPLMQNYQLFGPDSGLHQKNYVVWIDLRQGESGILQQMRRDLRRMIRRATEQNVEIILSDLRPDHVKEFHRIYTVSMERLNALPMFFLPLDFFQKLCVDMRDHVAIFLAVWNGEVIASYMFLHYGQYVYPYLGGSHSSHWDLKANVLCYYKAALWAQGQGYQYYIFGGGHAAEVDNVFHFKSQFSPNRAPYYMYRHVHDQEAYQRLCAMKQEFDADEEAARIGEAAPKDPFLVNYFPAYRA